jgi:hypothetical protein
MRDEPRERAEERRLPRSRRAEECNDLAGLQPEGDVLERRMLRFRIAELEPGDLD